MKTTFIIIFCALFYSLIIGQQEFKSNLGVIHSLVDESIQNIITDLPVEDVVYSIEYNSPPEFTFIGNRVKYAIGKIVSVTDNKENSLYHIIYNINEISTTYKNPEKDGFFGGYFVDRNILLKGSFVIKNKDVVQKADDFLLTATDTVAMDSISDLESMTLPFTKGKNPDEPFFASLVEPAIAIGAIAVTIILFFTVRSN